MKEARVKGRGGDCYHCVSRILDRRPVLGGPGKEAFRAILRQCEEFCGVRLLTYAVLDDHFHVLVEVPEPGKVSDAEFLRRVAALYPKPLAQNLAATLRKIRASGGEEAEKEARLFKERYTRRMGDVSEFLKVLKQRFTQGYNQQANRRGTLWENGFKSLLVEGRGRALATMAAYIDLNAVRAGLARDPKDYPACGYGEAAAGSARAQAGLGRVMAGLAKTSRWADVQREYRTYLYEAGRKTAKRAGVGPGQVRKALDLGRTLTLAQALRCRVRYFSDGVALGSREFVDSVFESNRGYFGAKRRSGARPMKQADWGGLCTARALRLKPIQAPTGPGPAR